MIRHGPSLPYQVSFAAGTGVRVAVRADAGNRFEAWSGDLQEKGWEGSIEVNGDLSVADAFALS